MFYPLPKQLSTQEAANRTLGEVMRISRQLRARRITDAQAEDQLANYVRGLLPHLCTGTADAIRTACTYPPRARRAFVASLDDIETALDDLAFQNGGTKGTTTSFPSMSRCVPGFPL